MPMLNIRVACCTTRAPGRSNRATSFQSRNILVGALLTSMRDCGWPMPAIAARKPREQRAGRRAGSSLRMSLSTSLHPALSGQRCITTRHEPEADWAFTRRRCAPLLRASSLKNKDLALVWNAGHAGCIRHKQCRLMNLHPVLPACADACPSAYSPSTPVPFSGLLPLWQFPRFASRRRWCFSAPGIYGPRRDRLICPFARVRRTMSTSP